MTVQSMIRRVAFLVIIAGGLMAVPAHAFDPPQCPPRVCEGCPAEWGEEPCFIPYSISATCSQYGCYNIGTCMDGNNEVTRCFCDWCEY